MTAGSNKAHRNWLQDNPGKAKGLVFLLCVLFLELSCRALVGVGLLKHITYPTNARPVYWAYIDPVVGIWHYPNTQFHHATDCIDQLYTTNSVGARDPERSLASTDAQRAVVLGDSMVEGFGVANGERLTDLLEQRTGIEHLNFGVAGSFGTIQEWLYYREYASHYDHTNVLVFLLPANDFRDNNPAEFDASIYRPYLRPADTGYSVWYPVSFGEREEFKRPMSTVIKNTLDNNLYILNALRFGLSVLKNRLNHDEPAEAVASYDNYSPNDLAVMTYALQQIATLAGDRNVYLFTIPDEGDIEYAKQHGYDFRLVNELTAFSVQHPNVHYLDLLPGMLNYTEQTDTRFRDLTLGCDPHWNALGNEVVAQLVQDFVYRQGGTGKNPDAASGPGQEAMPTAAQKFAHNEGIH